MQSRARHWSKLLLVQLLCGGLYIFLNYWTVREDVGQVLATFFALFALMFLSIRWAKDEPTIRILLVCAVLFRLSLLGSVPNLSDDVYRFLWDGRLWANHINPFAQPPLFYGMNMGKLMIPGINKALYNQIYAGGIFYASYPPLCQLIFYLATVFNPTHLMGNIVAIKLILLLFDLGAILLLRRLLRHLKLPAKFVLLYALNPLIIVEIVGNAHFESMMVFFLLFALWEFYQQHWNRSAILFACAVCVKLFPLIFLPLLVRRVGWKRTLSYGSVVAICCVLLYLPLFWNRQTFVNYMVGLTRFFQVFEFNGSVYFLLRWMGYQLIGYNLIKVFGRVLALWIFIGVWWMVWREKRPRDENLPEMMLLALTLYFFMALVVHPWYLSTLLAVGVLTRRRYVYLWACLVPMTYVTYQNPHAYQENYWLVFLEYALVWGWILAERAGLPQRISWLSETLYGLPPEPLLDEKGSSI